MPSANYRQVVVPTEEMPDDSEVDAMEQRPVWRRSRLVAAAVAAPALIAAAIGGGVSMHQSFTISSAPGGASKGTVLAEEAPAAGDERMCLELPGVRLQNGDGSADGSGKNATSGHECAMRCREESGCKQSVWTNGNNGCYLFESSVEDLKEYQLKKGEAPSTATFHSAVCGKVAEVAVAKVDARKAKLAAVQKGWEEAEKRAKDHVAKLPANDKFTLTHGSFSQSGFAGFMNGVGGSAPMTMNDGPQGFNPYTDPQLAGTSTQFPCLLAVAASFNPVIAQKYAGAISEEFVGKGSNTLLGPDLEVIRVGSTGRSFETLSGEDPYLGSRLAAVFVEEVQKHGIISTIKHWLDNNQEIRRQTLSSVVPARAQHEIYMAPFKAAIDAGAAAVMCSYNKVDGTYACENKQLLTDLLRTSAGFRGMVMSDWGATHDAKRSVDAGLDVEMPGNGGMMEKLPTLVGQGSVQQAQVDRMAEHVLAARYYAGHFDSRFPGQVPNSVARADVTSDAHRAVAVETIKESAVLLKNKEATLPLQTKGKKIAFVGVYCKQTVFIAPDHVTASTGTPFMGQGSGYVPTVRTISPMQGFQDRVKDAASITWSGDSSAAADADIAIVCASACDVHEGWDRMNYSLPEADDLVAGVKKVNKNARVVMVGITPGAVTSEWISDTDAALLMFMPGEQIGVALASMLIGESSPGGRLPITMPPDGWKPIGGYPAGKDHQFLSEQYPGTQPAPHKQYKWGDHLIVNFTEGVLEGYRWFDAQKEVTPAFPFGFGLSYTEFSMDGFKAQCVGDKIVASVVVSNDGERAGQAVPQLYVSFPSMKPALRQLKGFQKFDIAAGGKANAVFVVTPEDASYFDEGKNRWVSAAEKGEEVTVLIGSSSGDLPFKKALSCGGGAKDATK